MMQPEAPPLPEPTPPASPTTSLARQTVDFLVVLALSILLFRTFAAEAYIVPTGSMAPTLLGSHKELICPNCSFRFAMGLDDHGEGLAGPKCGLVPTVGMD